MKNPVVARGIVKIEDATPIGEETEAGQLVQIRTSSYFVYDGEEGAQFEWVQRERQAAWRNGLPRISKGFEWEKTITERVFQGLADVEKHAFVQLTNGMLTPYGAVELKTNLATLGWDYRELAARAGVSAGAVRDAVLRTSSCTNTYPKMLLAVLVGLDAKARLDAVKAKAAA